MPTANINLTLPVANGTQPWPVLDSTYSRSVFIDCWPNWLRGKPGVSISSATLVGTSGDLTISSITNNTTSFRFLQSGGSNSEAITLQFELTLSDSSVEVVEVEIPIGAAGGNSGFTFSAYIGHKPKEASSGGGGGGNPSPGGVTEQQVDDKIGTAIGTEVTNRDTAIATATTNLGSALVNNISSAVSTLRGETSAAITAEVTSRNAAISGAVTPIATQANTNTAAIAQEVSDRTAADTALGGRIDTNTTGITTNAAAITKEIGDRTTADTALGGRIDGNTTNITANTAAITKEINDRTTADTALGGRIDANTTNITANTSAITKEINDRTAADTALSGRIDSNTTNITANTSAITKEINDRTAADTALGSRIDTTNTNVTNNANAITQEVSDRKAAITQEVSDRNAAISAATSGSTGPRIDKTGVSTTPTDGGTYAIPATTSLVRFRNTAPLKVLNITLPTSGVVDGQEIEILAVNTLGTIASLVFTPGVSGYPTANNLPLPGGGKLRLVYDNTAGSWALASTVLNVHVWHGNFKNLLHNSTMLINQRGFTSSTANGNYAVFDRWFHTDSATGTRTITAVTLTDTDRLIAGDESIASAIRVQTTGDSAASSFEYIYQNLEDVRRTAGRIVTFSFYAKAAAANQPVAVEFYQNFGSGGSPSSAVSTPAGLFQLTTTLKRYFGTVTLPTCQGKTFGTTPNTDYLGLFIYQSAGSAYNTRASAIGPQTSDVTITGLQLEFGNSPTLLERRDRELELNFCRRFYQVVRNYFVLYSGGNGFGLPISNPLNPPMRASPTVVSRSFASTSNFGGETVASAISQPERYIAQVVGSAAGATYADATWVLSADL